MKKTESHELYFKGLPYIKDFYRKKYLFPKKYETRIEEMYFSCPIFNMVCKKGDYIFVTDDSPIFKSRELNLLRIDGLPLEIPENLTSATWVFIKRMTKVHDEMYYKHYLA